MGLEKTMNLRCKHFQGEDHKRDLVRVWIKFMFTAGKRASSELTLLRSGKHPLLTLSRRVLMYLKSLSEQCCLQTGSWYSSSSNRTGLQLVEEPSCDWEDPRGLWRAWLLGKRHTSRPFPCSWIAIVSVNLYKSDTFNLCPYLRTRKTGCLRIFFFSLF